MRRPPPDRPVPRGPLWLLAGLVLLSVIAVVAVVVVALQYRDGSVTAYAPMGGERPSGLAMPDPVMSPGDVFPVGVEEICVPGYSARVRDVSTATKNKVYAAYGITSRKPGEYEMDHIVPLEIGGSNDVKNLFPQPEEPRPGFREKDVLENTLHDLVCSGQLDLKTAQDAIAKDWWAAYVQYVLHR